jgi:hypothetical protein
MATAGVKLVDAALINQSVDEPFAGRDFKTADAFNGERGHVPISLRCAKRR